MEKYRKTLLSIEKIGDLKIIAKEVGVKNISKYRKENKNELIDAILSSDKNEIEDVMVRFGYKKPPFLGIRKLDVFKYIRNIVATIGLITIILFLIFPRLKKFSKGQEEQLKDWFKSDKYELVESENSLLKLEENEELIIPIVQKTRMGDYRSDDTLIVTSINKAIRRIISLNPDLNKENLEIHITGVYEEGTAAGLAYEGDFGDTINVNYWDEDKSSMFQDEITKNQIINEEQLGLIRAISLRNILQDRTILDSKSSTLGITRKDKIDGDIIIRFKLNG